MNKIETMKRKKILQNLKVDYEKALTYLKWLIQLELFGTIDTERTPKKQEIKPGIDL